MKDCNDCEHICPPERLQTKNHEAHVCLKSSRVVFHEGQHPILPTPYGCPLKNEPDTSKQ